MFIECIDNHGTAYLRVMEGYRVEVNGVSKSRRRVVRNIGPLSRYDDGKPEYIARLRQSFREGEPLIPSLADLLGGTAPQRRVTLCFDLVSDADSFADPKNIGYFLLDGLYDALGVYDVLNKHKSQSRIEYDLNGLSKLLVFGRALSPDSKIGTFNRQGAYRFSVANAENPIEIYRTLDVLDTLAGAIQRRMNTKIENLVGRNTEVCFYDVTNYWFEIGENDPDILDEAGNVQKSGMRKKGVSKENRKEPIVQMGLFIDDNGIPIAYKLFPGNRTDQTTIIPALEKTVDTMKLGRVIVVADGGLNTGPNIAHIVGQGNGYILSKSTKKSDKTVKKWILDPDGYEWNAARTFKVKSMLRMRKVKGADGKTVELAEKLVCFWSKNHYERERHENAKFMEYLESVLANPDKLKDKPRKIDPFLKKMQIDKETGEVIDTGTHLSIDTEKVQEYVDLMGYYTIMTSETGKTNEEIISKYHGLSRIEDSFRITKGDLEGRPVFVWTPEHINAHFLICFIALTMLRLIQHRILKHQGKNTLGLDGWESGLSASRIQQALNRWTADALPSGFFRLSKPEDDLRAILRAFGLDADLRFPDVKTLRSFKLRFDSAVLSHQ